MKTTKKLSLAALISLLSITAAFAQTDKKNQALEEFTQPPKSTEKVVDVITKSVYGGYEYDDYVWDPEAVFYYNDSKTGKAVYGGRWMYNKHVDNLKKYTEEELLQKLLESAREKYKETYPVFSLRNFKSQRDSRAGNNNGNSTQNEWIYNYNFSATVVIPDPKEEANENLSKAIDKSLSNVRQGSRVAIDQITVWEEINKDDYKDQLIDALLDKGYKVVAKEYLKKLYEEQQNQQSGIYNDRTIVQENNFSAVGYYINVKVTKASLRIQVVNVSTGEYEGNATIKFE
jgi:hypothetical protein